MIVSFVSHKTTFFQSDVNADNNFKENVFKIVSVFICLIQVMLGSCGSNCAKDFLLKVQSIFETKIMFN
jgi:hypothetical protein